MRIPKQSDYPKELVIGENVWRVKFRRKMDPGLLGLCDPSTYTISIAQKQNPMQTLYTFVHEVLHAIEFENDCIIGEKAVLVFEKGITDFILENWPAFGRDR